MANKQIIIVKPENWYWCDVCHCISYDYECECGSSYCNCAGCEKCADLQKIVRDLYEEKRFPSEEECKQNSIKKWGSIESPETL